MKVNIEDMTFDQSREPSFNQSLNDLYVVDGRHLPTGLRYECRSAVSFEEAQRDSMNWIEKQLELIENFLMRSPQEIESRNQKIKECVECLVKKGFTPSDYEREYLLREMKNE